MDRTFDRRWALVALAATLLAHLSGSFAFGNELDVEAALQRKTERRGELLSQRSVLRTNQLNHEAFAAPLRRAASTSPDADPVPSLRPGRYSLNAENAARFRVDGVLSQWIEISLAHPTASLALATSGGLASPVSLRGRNEVRQVVAHDRFLPLEIDAWSSRPDAQVQIREIQAGLCAHAEVDDTARLLVEQIGGHLDLVPFASGQACAGVDPGAVELRVLADVHSGVFEAVTAVARKDETQIVTLGRGTSRQIMGRVTTDSGSPIAGAWVGAYDSITELLIRQTVADATGNYVLESLSPGTYLVLFEASSSVSELHDDVTCLGGLEIGCTLADGTAVDVTAGDATIDAALSPAGSVRGRVTSAGQPVEGAIVWAYEAGGLPVTFGVSDSAGAYTIDQLQDGSWAVLATATGFDGQLWQGVECPDGIPTDCTVEDGMPVTTTIGTNTPGVDFELAQRGSVSGYVTDTPGDPLYARVELFDAAGRFVDNSTSDPIDGRWEILGLAAGDYFARAYVPPPSVFEPIEFLGEIYNDLGCDDWQCPIPTSGTPIPVQAGSPTDGVSFSLGRLSRIHFELRSTGGNALPFSTQVNVYDVEGVLVSTPTSNSQGTASTVPLRPGTYFAIATASGYSDVLYDQIVCDPVCDPLTGTPIELSPDVDLQVPMRLPTTLGTIEGELRSAYDGRLISGEVTVYDASGALVRRVRAFGSFSTGGLPEGPYWVHASAHGHVGQLHDQVTCPEPPPGESCDLALGTAVPVGGQGIAELFFVLDQLPSVRGEVINDAGEFVWNANVALFDSAGTELQSLSTGSDGAFQFFFEEGEVFVGATQGSHVGEVYDQLPCDPFPSACDPTEGTPISSSLNQVADIEVTLARFPEIRVRVFDRNAQPVRSRIELYNEFGYLTSANASDHTFVVEPHVQHFLFIRADPYVSRLYDEINCDIDQAPSCDAVANGTPIVLAPNESFVADIALDSLPRVRGVIVDRQGEPVGGYPEVFDQQGVSIWPVWSDSSPPNGYEVAVQPGTYTFTSSPNGHVPQVWPSLDCLEAGQIVPCDPALGTPLQLDINDIAEDVDFEHYALASMQGSLLTDAPNSNMQTIRLYDADGTAVRRTDRAAPSEYSFHDLVAGTYFLAVEGSPFVNQLWNDIDCGLGTEVACEPLHGTPIEIGFGDHLTDIDFFLEPGLTIQGVLGASIFSTTNSPRIDIWDSSGTRLESVASEFNGFTFRFDYAITSARGGNFYLTTDSIAWTNQAYPDLLCWGRFGDDCDPTAGTTVGGAVGETATANFPISGAQALNGRVRLNGSIPAANAVVRAWDATGQIELNATITAADGRFAWSNTPEGDYRVTASAPGYRTIVWPDAACPEPCIPGNLGAIVQPRQDASPLFLNFALPRQPEIFTDSFESGDAAAWGSSVP